MKLGSAERGESKAKWFGGSSANDFPNIDVHSIGHHFEFVDQSDVDSPVDVFQKFGQFGHFGGGDGHNVIEDGSIKSNSGFQTGWGGAANHFRYIDGGEFGTEGALALTFARAAGARTICVIPSSEKSGPVATGAFARGLMLIEAFARASGFALSANCLSLDGVACDCV